MDSSDEASSLLLLHEFVSRRCSSNDGNENLQIEPGENWLRLLKKPRRSVLDETQSTQDFVGSEDTTSTIYPSIVSLSNVGGNLATSSNDCFICIDVDGNALAVKDMRPRIDGDTSIEPQLGICRSKSNSWKVLPRRQLRIFHPGDKLCTSLVNAMPAEDGHVFEYKSRETTQIKLDVNSEQPLLTQPEDEDNEDGDDDDKTVDFERDVNPKNTGQSLDVITQPDGSDRSSDESDGKEKPLDEPELSSDEKEAETIDIDSKIDDSENKAFSSTKVAVGLLTQPRAEDGSSDDDTDFDETEKSKQTEMKPSSTEDLQPEDSSDSLVASENREENDEALNRTRGIFSPNMVAFSEDPLAGDQGSSKEQNIEDEAASEKKTESSTQKSECLLTPVKNTEDGKVDNKASESSHGRIATSPPAEEMEEKPNSVSLLSPEKTIDAKVDEQMLEKGEDGNDSDNLLDDSDDEKEKDNSLGVEASEKLAVTKEEERIIDTHSGKAGATDQVDFSATETKSEHEALAKENDDKDDVDFGNNMQDNYDEGSETQLMEVDKLTAENEEKQKQSDCQQPKDEKEVDAERLDSSVFNQSKDEQEVQSDPRNAVKTEASQTALPGAEEKGKRPIPGLESDDEFAFRDERSIDGSTVDDIKSQQLNAKKDVEPETKPPTNSDESTPPTNSGKSKPTSNSDQLTINSPQTSLLLKAGSSPPKSNSTRISEGAKNRTPSFDLEDAFAFQADSTIGSKRAKRDNSATKKAPKRTYSKRVTSPFTPEESKREKSPTHYSKALIGSTPPLAAADRTTTRSIKNFEAPLAASETSAETNDTGKRPRQSPPEKTDAASLVPPVEKRPPRKRTRQTPTAKSTTENATPSSTAASSVGSKSARKRTRQSPALESSARVNGGPVVMTTGVELTASQKNMIKRIDGVLLENTEDAVNVTHVIAGSRGSSIRRTPKLMIGLCKTNNIVDLEWLVQSAKQRKVLSSKNFQLVNDKKAEAQYKFSMHSSLQRAGVMRASGQTLFGGYSLFCCRGVAGNKNRGNMTPPSKEFRLILESAGGAWLSSLPNKEDLTGTVIIVSKVQSEAKKQLSTKKMAEALEKGAVAKTTEDIFHSIMLQEFDL